MILLGAYSNFLTFECSLLLFIKYQFVFFKIFKHGVVFEWRAKLEGNRVLLKTIDILYPDPKICNRTFVMVFTPCISPFPSCPYLQLHKCNIYRGKIQSFLELSSHNNLLFIH